MKKLFFCAMLLLFGGSSFILIYASIQSELLVQKLFMFFMSLIGFIPSYYLIKELSHPKDIKYEFHNDDLVIYENNDRYKDIKKIELDSIYFETPYSQLLVFCMSDGDKYKYQPPGLGPKVVHEIESWWGKEIVGKKDNLSYRRMVIYHNLINKVF